MKRIISLLIAVLMIVSMIFAVPFTADAIEVSKSQTSVEELMSNVYVDVSAVESGDDTFWAYIWNAAGADRWEPLENSEIGYLVVKMRAGEYAVFTRINCGAQPDWLSVNLQTRDTQYTGIDNCAVLSYSYTAGIMDVEWKYIDNADKSDLVKVMREAEKHLNEEADTYTAKSMAYLQDCYSVAQDCYEKITGRFEVDMATYKLRDAIFSLELIAGSDTVDKNKLSQAISTAISYYMSLDNFTSYSWNYMLEKLDDAQTVDRNKNAPQGVVDFAAQELFDAIDGLERVEELIGDVDGDGGVSVMDATLIQRHLARLDTIDVARYRYADAYKDGEINVFDATMIQRFIAQLIPSL